MFTLLSRFIFSGRESTSTKRVSRVSKGPTVKNVSNLDPKQKTSTGSERPKEKSSSAGTSTVPKPAFYDPQRREAAPPGGFSHRVDSETFAQSPEQFDDDDTFGIATKNISGASTSSNGQQGITLTMDDFFKKGRAPVIGDRPMPTRRQTF